MKNSPFEIIFLSKRAKLTYFYYKSDEFYCEGVPVRKIAEEFGTPVYIYSKAQIVQNFETLKNSLHNSKILYALKANSNPSILKIINQLGAGADTVSAGEIYLALKSGFKPEKISFAGVGKYENEIKYAIEKDIFSLNVESEQELFIISEIAQSLNKKVNVLIRVNPDIDAKTHPHISTGIKTSKFGIDPDDAIDVFKKASKLPSIVLLGIHTHIGSQIVDVEPFVETAKFILKYIEKLEKEGIRISHIDFGGGIGVKYKNVIINDKLPFEENDDKELKPEIFASEVLPILEKSGCDLMFEPGRFIIANAGIIVGKVIYTKKSKAKNFIITDISMTELIRPAFYNAYHQIVPVVLNSGKVEIADIVGPVCETSDFIARDRKIPEVSRGDYIAVMTTGAYGFVSSSNYNARLRPAEVLIDGENYYLIREPETFEDLLSKTVWIKI
ncbi:MAG: diaminopimelate decarboxylase [Candidatus Kryptonium sp.]